MKNYDVIVKAEFGDIVATLEAENDVPTGLLLQAVMSHAQLFPHFVRMNANQAEVLAVKTPSVLALEDGLTIMFTDGVSINGPIAPSPVPNVPREFAGRLLTHNLRALVQYHQDPDALDEPGGDDMDEASRVRHSTPGYNGTFSVN